MNAGVTKLRMGVSVFMLLLLAVAAMVVVPGDAQEKRVVMVMVTREQKDGDTETTVRAGEEENWRAAVSGRWRKPGSVAVGEAEDDGEDDEKEEDMAMAIHKRRRLRRRRGRGWWGGKIPAGRPAETGAAPTSRKLAEMAADEVAAPHAGRRRTLTYETPVYAVEGQFLAVLTIGTPPVSFTAIIDTGSDLVWRQCKPCTRCYEQTAGFGFPIFDPSRSSSFRRASCRDPLCTPDQLYGATCAAAPGARRRTCAYEGLYDDPPAFTRGEFAFDTLSISDTASRLHTVRAFAFGCSHESFGPYDFAGSGGIVGLGEGELSLPSQLGITKFSYCLNRIHAWNIFDVPPPSSPSLARISPWQLQERSSGGLFPASPASPLLLGDGAHLGGGNDIQSTRIVAQGYIVELEGISVAGHRLNLSRSLFRDGGTLIDSGTTFSTLPTEAFHSLYSAFRARIPQKPRHGAGPRNLSLCYSSLPSPLPSLSFHFKGAHLRLPPQNYFVRIDGLFCLAIVETRDSETIYGNVQQQDFHILYDLHARLISFKPTACSSLRHR